MISYISLEPEDTVDPVQDDGERLGLAHVLLALDKSAESALDRPPDSISLSLPCNLGHSILKYDIHVVNWIDLVVITLSQSVLCGGLQKFHHTYIDQEQLRAGLRQCTIVEQRELVGFLLELLLISAVSELVCQSAAEAV